MDGATPPPPPPPPSAAVASEPEFTVLSERAVYERYLTVLSRSVRHPDGAVHEYDVVAHPRAGRHFCVVFPFHPPAAGGGWEAGEVTLIAEYGQGPNGIVYCLPSGGMDPGKHATREQCARAELSEEAHLAGGELVPLLPAGHAGVPEVKWCANRFTPFVCLAPAPDAAPGRRDAEEYIHVLRVRLPELRRIMRSGQMLLPSVTTCWWAFEWLAERDERLRQAGG